MLVILGGLSGSGRKDLAQDLSRITAWHYVDIDEWKLHRPRMNAVGAFVVEPPITDEAVTRTYREAIKSFPLLSKMHEHVILEDTLHRAAARELLIAQAQRSFGRVVFIWVESDDGLVHARLTNLKHRGIIRSIRYMHQLRAQLQQHLDPLPATTHRFDCSACTEGEMRAEAERLKNLILSLSSKAPAERT